jgi:hypothetical protein
MQLISGSFDGSKYFEKRRKLDIFRRKYRNEKLGAKLIKTQCTPALKATYLAPAGASTCAAGNKGPFSCLILHDSISLK